jgi:hypothetical protein
MDAEPILLPKICDVRSHFRVSICDAIFFVDRLKKRVEVLRGRKSGINISRMSPLNRRSLDCAPPDFLWNLVALARLMRLSLKERRTREHV